jgi:hypothetical protein
LLVYGQDRAAVMIEARRQYQITRRLGWSSGRTLAYSWAKIRRQVEQAEQAANKQGNA